MLHAQLFQVGLEHRRRGHAVAHQIAGQQIIVVPAQVVLQAVHLAGQTGKEHRLARLQLLLHLMEGFPKIALDILGAPHGGRLLHGGGAGVAHRHIAVKGGAVHHAPLVQHMAGQQGEHTAGGAAPPHLVVFVPNSVGAVGVGALHRLGQGRAGAFALAAENAVFPHRGPQEALMVGFHLNGVYRTDGGAGGAAGAVLRLAQIGPGRLLSRAPLLRQGGALHRRFQIGQGVGPGGLQLLINLVVVHLGVDGGGGVQADDAVGASQPGKQAVDPGEGGLPPLLGGHGGEEILLELEREGRPVEGVGHHRGGVLEQAQKLPGSGVKDQLFGPVDLLAGSRQLDNGPAGPPGQGLGVGGRLPGLGDKVAQDVGALMPGRRGQLPPVLAIEQQGGVQHHLGLPLRRLTDQHLAPLFPDGEGGEGRQEPFQLRRLVLGQLGHAQTGGVGDAAALPHKVQQEGGVELLVLEDIGIPNLVAARHIYVVGRRVLPELPEIGVPPGREVHLLRHKGLKALKPALEGGIMEGGMGVRRHIPHGGAFFENLVGAGGMGQAIVNDLTFMTQALNGLHGGQGLELCAVMMGKMECDETGAHRLTPHLQAFIMILFSIPQEWAVVYRQNRDPSHA